MIIIFVLANLTHRQFAINEEMKLLKMIVRSHTNDIDLQKSNIYQIMKKNEILVKLERDMQAMNAMNIEDLQV